MATMTVDDVSKDAEAKMNKAMEATRSDFASIRTGRAAPSERMTVRGSASAATNKARTIARKIGAIKRRELRACNSHRIRSSPITGSK